MEVWLVSSLGLHLSRWASGPGICLGGKPVGHREHMCSILIDYLQLGHQVLVTVTMCTMFLFYTLNKQWKSEVTQSCPTLCNPMDCSLSGSSVPRIFQARVLEWIAISFTRRSSQPRDWTRASLIAGRHFTVWPIQCQISSSSQVQESIV